MSTNASVSVSRCAVAIEIAGGQHDNKHAACHLFISTYLHISTHPAADIRISRLSTYRHSVQSVTGLPVKQLKLKMTIDYDEILTHIGELGNLKSNVVENAEHL